MAKKQEPKQKTIAEMSSEDLALALNVRYQRIRQDEIEIQAINQELQKRQQEKNNG